MFFGRVELEPFFGGVDLEPVVLKIIDAKSGYS
jgi:hypothetical protein